MTIEDAATALVKTTIPRTTLKIFSQNRQSENCCKTGADDLNIIAERLQRLFGKPQRPDQE